MPIIYHEKSFPRFVYNCRRLVIIGDLNFAPIARVSELNGAPVNPEEAERDGGGIV